jgi:hypothetical protein
MVMEGITILRIVDTTMGIIQKLPKALLLLSMQLCTLLKHNLKLNHKPRSLPKHEQMMAHMQQFLHEPLRNLPVIILLLLLLLLLLARQDITTRVTMVIPTIGNTKITLNTDMLIMALTPMVRILPTIITKKTGLVQTLRLWPARLIPLLPQRLLRHHPLFHIPQNPQLRLKLQSCHNRTQIRKHQVLPLNHLVLRL